MPPLNNQKRITFILIILILLVIISVTTLIFFNQKDIKKEKSLISDIKTAETPLSFLNNEESEPDSDQDGLTDKDEKEIYKTDPNKKDTDNDGLSDSQEIVTYQTNTLNKDTDNDGFRDKEEIERNLNPNGEGDSKKGYILPFGNK